MPSISDFLNSCKNNKSSIAMQRFRKAYIAKFLEAPDQYPLQLPAEVWESYFTNWTSNMNIRLHVDMELDPRRIWGSPSRAPGVRERA